MHERVIVRQKIISQYCTREQIGNLLGLNCDKRWKIADRRANTDIIERCHGWIINSGIPEDAALEAHLEALLGKLANYSDQIMKLAERDLLEFSCVIYTEVPALNFNKVVLQRITALGTSAST
ncbi:MAG TPA: DUF4279 domain-containing protein [Verrucomicrobiae bacterium]|jgi:hypothetical protein